MLLTYLACASFSLGLHMTEAAAIELATQTLARELGVDAEGLEIVRTVPVSWPDSSLGCGSPGRSYLQVIVPGYRVDIRRAGRVHRVHVGDGRAVYCQGGVGKITRIHESEAEPTTESRLSRLAREDLASRLGVEPDTIRVEFTEARTWRDSSLGCPVEGRSYEEDETKGFLIGFVHAGETYEYHTDETKPVLCEGRVSR